MPDPWERVPEATVAALGYGKYLAHANIGLATAACAVVWGGWPLLGKLYVHQYDTGALAAAYQVLEDAAGDLGAGRTNIADLVAGLSAEQWPGDDRRDFDAWMRTLGSDLLSEEMSARLLGIMLLVSASLLFAFIVYTSAVVLRLVWLAVQVLRASFGGGVGFLAAQVAAGKQARVLFAQFQAQEARLTTALNGIATAIAAGLGAKVAKDSLTGDRQGLLDLRQATINQGPALVWGFANHVERNLTAKMMTGRSPLFSGRDARAGTGAKGQPRPMPASPHDLTPTKWQLGAAAKGAMDVISGRMPTGFLLPDRYESGAYQGYEDIERRL
ncbi:hypothetical protein ACFWYW_13265 [Nonomuraea sp. NPDC059023]|uniref:hypothetical protein n=1 Tax=unclassified Nonomuraea TaxID=2593643 RepID=UPI00368529AE